MKQRSLAWASCLATLLTAPMAAVAHDAGDWMVRGGISNVSPKSDNGGIVEVDDAFQVTFNVLYMLSQNWGVELLAALPFEHDVSLDGGPEVATVKHLPPTLSLVYHLLPGSPVQPYLGLGLNMTLFMDESTKGPLAGTKLSLDTSIGAAAVVGVDIALGDNWFLNADVRYMDIDTDAKLDGVKLGTVEIDPWVFGLNLAYRF
jgi:outer membrane protein